MKYQSGKRHCLQWGGEGVRKKKKRKEKKKRRKKEEERKKKNPDPPWLCPLAECYTCLPLFSHQAALKLTSPISARAIKYIRVTLLVTSWRSDSGEAILIDEGLSFFCNGFFPLLLPERQEERRGLLGYYMNIVNTNVLCRFCFFLRRCIQKSSKPASALHSRLLHFLQLGFLSPTPWQYWSNLCVMISSTQLTSIDL